MKIILATDGSDAAIDAARAGARLLGNGGDHVVHHAPCPVLVIRSEEGKASEEAANG